MGAWGTGLYQNDTSLDVKDEFVDKLHRGKSPEEITAEMIEDYACIMDDAEEAPLFWFALADTQWKRGMLLPEVKEKALFWIDKGGDIALWEEEPRLAAKRKKVIEALKEELLAPQPPRKTYKPYNLYHCQWQFGDVYAYLLESDLAKEKGLAGKYLLIQKVDEGTWHPGHTIPIVYVKITQDSALPTSVEEYNELEYVQVSHSIYEEVKWPEGMVPAEEVLKREARQREQLDAYGFLPEFRLSLISTSKRVIPKKLSFVGNFSGAARPPKEYIPSYKLNLRTLWWKEFEDDMIIRYFGHNKRESEIYRRQKEAL